MFKELFQYFSERRADVINSIERWASGPITAFDTELKQRIEALEARVSYLEDKLSNSLTSKVTSIKKKLWE